MIAGGDGQRVVVSPAGAMRTVSRLARVRSTVAESSKKKASMVSVTATRYRTPGTAKNGTRALSPVALNERPAFTRRSTKPHGCHCPVRGHDGSPGAGGRTTCGAPGGDCRLVVGTFAATGCGDRDHHEGTCARGARIGGVDWHPSIQRRCGPFGYWMRGREYPYCGMTMTIVRHQLTLPTSAPIEVVDITSANPHVAAAPTGAEWRC